jgi:hypothetical protein
MLYDDNEINCEGKETNRMNRMVRIEQWNKRIFFIILFILSIL